MASTAGRAGFESCESHVKTSGVAVASDEDIKSRVSYEYYWFVAVGQRRWNLNGVFPGCWQALLAVELITWHSVAHLHLHVSCTIGRHLRFMESLAWS